jgi:hypothetical protein
LHQKTEKRGRSRRQTTIDWGSRERRGIMKEQVAIQLDRSEGRVFFEFSGAIKRPIIPVGVPVEA